MQNSCIMTDSSAAMSVPWSWEREDRSLTARLPPELLRLIGSHLDAVHMMALAGCCRALRDAADDPTVWRDLLARQLAPMVRSFFDGELPSPEEGLSWKRWHFELRSSWKQRAQRLTGKLLIQVCSQRLSGRQPDELISIWDAGDFWWAPRPHTYGVYDVSSFVYVHPGADLIIKDAAAEADATNTFEINGHSDAAVRMLATLAVSGLECLRYDLALEDARRRARSRRLGVPTAVLAVACAVCLSLFLTRHPRYAMVPALWPLGATAAVAAALWRCVRERMAVSARAVWSLWLAGKRKSHARFGPPGAAYSVL